MIKTYKDLLAHFEGREPVLISVAVAQDADVLEAVEAARKKGIINAVLVGDADEIKKIAGTLGIDTSLYDIIDRKEKSEACLEAVKLVHDGKAVLPMKGFVDTSVFLKAVLNKEVGLNAGRLISHCNLFAVNGFDHMFIVTDSAMNIAPDLNAKADIIRNAVDVAKGLGIEQPKVAVLCAVETPNPKMPATLDAEELTKMNERGEITDCPVKGPLAMDNAVSPEAAAHKGIVHPVAGNADILLCPDIEAGNILNKSMEYFARAEKAGVIMGARTPIILTSRASSPESKMNSIALSVLCAEKMAGR